METILEAIHANKCNVDILTGYDDKKVFRWGVRLRPWKQNSDPEMIIAKGDTVDHALAFAVKMAEANRWEPMDWAKRPWIEEAKRAGWGR